MVTTPDVPTTSLAFSTLNHAPMFGCQVPLGEQVRAAADAGFDAVSLDVFSIRALFEEGGTTALAALAEPALDVLDISALVLSDDAETSAANVAEMRTFTEVLRPSHVLVKLHGPIDTLLLDRLRDAAGALSASGATLAVEPSVLDQVATLADGQRVVADAAIATMGLVLDTWHFFVGSDDWDALETAPFDLIAFLQLADGRLPATDDLTAETLHHRSLPGEGSFDLGRLFEVVAAAGWSGPVCVEVLSAAGRAQSVHDFAAAAQRAAATLLRNIPAGER